MRGECSASTHGPPPAPQPSWSECGTERETPIAAPNNRICFLFFLMTYVAFNKDNMADGALGT